jgi:antitoxin (DNA-binding transcriptional repressor) of toxin-antitoxin stability system
VNIHEAKINLSRLRLQVEKGEEIIIARAGKPIARLTKFTQKAPKRQLGRDAGLFEVSENFDDPLSED